MRQLLAVLSLMALLSGNVSAADPLHRLLLPEEVPLILEINDPLRLTEHPLAERIFDRLLENPEIAEFYESAEFDPLRQLTFGLEQSMGVDAQTAIRRLTAGGLTVGVIPGKSPRVGIIMTAADEDSLSKFIKFGQDYARVQQAGEGKQLVIESKEYKGFTGYKVGDAFYAQVKNHLLVTTRAEDLKTLVDRYLALPRSPAATETDANAPLARLHVNWKALREQSQEIQQGLIIPHDKDTPNRGVLALFGGYIDLARRADAIDAELTLEYNTITLTATASAGNQHITPGLERFFAPADQPIAPLLNVPNRIYAASWHRDYRHLWENRDKLLTPEAKKVFDEDDDNLKTQLATLGASQPFSEIVNQLGPHFRTVVARQETIPYQVELAERIPAGAFVVDLRDEEKFREYFGPILRTIGVFTTGGSQGQLINKSVQYKEAELMVLWFKDDAKTAAKGDKVRFNFSPAFSMTRGHFIAGSTQEIVQQVIDLLDAEKASPPAVPAHVTELETLSITEGAKALQDFRPALVRQAVLTQGVRPETGEKQVDLFFRILNDLGQLDHTSTFDDKSFRIELRLGSQR